MLLVGAESQLGAALGGLSSEAGQTEAPGHVVESAAVSVLATHVGQAAHIDTLVLDAGSLLAAVTVADALQGDTADVWVTFGPRRTGTHGSVVGRGADRVAATGTRRLAGVLALVVDAVSRGGAVVLGQTLVGRLTFSKGVRDRSKWTLAGVGA